MMKKIFALVLALAMTLALVACGGGDDGTVDQNSGEKVVKIGVFEPQTGDNGAGGKQETLGIQYANKETPTVEIGGNEAQLSSLGLKGLVDAGGVHVAVVVDHGHLGAQAVVLDVISGNSSLCGVGEANAESVIALNSLNCCS